MTLARRALPAGLFVAGMLYPLVVYFGQGRLSSLTLIALALSLIALRLFASAKRPADPLRIPLVFAAAGIAGIAFLDEQVAIRVYPVFVSLCLAVAFGHSLLHPPSLIERFARIREPDLPRGAAEYCRRVTIVWTAFTIFNATVAAGTALWATIEIWTLWTGVVSYFLLGALFLGELLVRRQVRSQFS